MQSPPTYAAVKEMLEADPPHIDAFNNARASHPAWIPTLSGVNLRAGTFRRANFDGIDFSRMNLEHTSFQRCSMRGCTFTRSNMRYVRMSKCDARKSTFMHTRMMETILNNCRFDDCTFNGSVLRCAKAQFSHFQGAQFVRATFDYTDLDGSDFTDAVFTGVLLNETRFMNATLTGADMTSIPDEVLGQCIGLATTKGGKEISARAESAHNEFVDQKFEELKKELGIPPKHLLP